LETDFPLPKNPNDTRLHKIITTPKQDYQILNKEKLLKLRALGSDIFKSPSRKLALISNRSSTTIEQTASKKLLFAPHILRTHREANTQPETNDNEESSESDHEIKTEKKLDGGISFYVEKLSPGIQDTDTIRTSAVEVVRNKEKQKDIVRNSDKITPEMRKPVATSLQVELPKKI